MDEFIQQLFADPEMLRMGHHQRKEDLNLGLGWMYYALGRMLRPGRAVCIGSWRGFVPAVMAKSMIDNVEGGELWFIDPSLADDFWAEPGRVAAHYEKLGVPNVRHFRYTTQEFVETEAYRKLDNVGLFMIDGYHSAEQAKFDYLAFLDKLSEQAVVMFHDSTRLHQSPIYNRTNPYTHTVCNFMEKLAKTPGLETFTLPFASGVTLVRGRPATLDYINEIDDA